MEVLRNFRPGPLDQYRKLASFDWKKLKVFLDTEEIIRFKENFTKFIKSNKAMDVSEDDYKSFDEIRRLAVTRTKLLTQYMNQSSLEYPENILKLWAVTEVTYAWDPSVSIRSGVDIGLFCNLFRSLATDDQSEVLDRINNGETMGCFALTEIAHGSNTKQMETRATYDKNTREFIINSPRFESAKCWVGHLGQCANHAILFAQLYTPDGVCHGLHHFVIQLRDLKTHKPLPGIRLADMGRKVGLNGIDNGVVQFDNLRVPKWALLNKNVNVSDDGVYQPKIKDPRRRHGAAMSTLSLGRVNITCLCSNALTNAVTIAVRYAAVRKQFGPENTNEEVSLLEYQTHQHRLLPYLAGAVMHRVFSRFLVSEMGNSMIKRILGVKVPDEFERGMEIHAISSASKPWSGWFSRDGIQECRESCGGHGYLKASRLGDLRSSNDANLTYEGENHVLIQQTSNWLFKFYPLMMQRKPISSPYKSVDFLSMAHELLSLKFQANSTELLMQPEIILQIYQFLVCYLLKVSYEKHEENLQKGRGEFWSKNENQVFYSRHLAVAYIQHFILFKYMDFLNECQDPQIRNVLMRVFSLYALFNLEKHHLGPLYKSGFFTGNEPAALIQDSILWLCKSLKNDAIALVDANASDDILLNSVLGHSDGQVYKRLEERIFSSKENTERPKWWQEMYRDVKAKL